VNGEPVEVIGAGLVDEQAGITRGWWRMTRVPRGFDPAILGAFLITGHPRATRPLRTTPNPFLGTSQRYTRELRFPGRPELGALDLTADCQAIGNTIESTFTLDGHLEVPRLTMMLDTVEAWAPQPDGSIRGVFAPTWETAEGEYIQATAVSHYVAEHPDGTPVVMPSPLLRLVSMAIAHRSDSSHATFTKHQYSSLMDPRAVHDVPTVLPIAHPASLDWTPLSVSQGHRVNAGSVTGAGAV